MDLKEQEILAKTEFGNLCMELMAKGVSLEIMGQSLLRTSVCYHKVTHEDYRAFLHKCIDHFADSCDQSIKNFMKEGEKATKFHEDYDMYRKKLYEQVRAQGTANYESN